MGICKGLQVIQILGLDQTLTIQAASYHNHNLLINITQYHFKSPSGIFGPLNHFLNPNPDCKELLSVAKSFLDFGPHKKLDPKI